ncbi:MAG: hypothetical protein AB7E79_14995 [Rhodospirillaceae bacterium]
MGKIVNGFDVSAKCAKGNKGWHFEIMHGAKIVEQSEPEHRDYAAAMKAGTMRALEMDAPE